MSELEEISITTRQSRKSLNKRQLLDYKSQRKDCLSWLLNFGKNPDIAEGYAFQTVSNRAYRIDAFYRWVWEQEDIYTADVTHSHADKWLRHLARTDKSNAHKSNCRKALQMLFKWREHQRGHDPWDPEISFSTSSGTTNPRDYLTRDERARVREAALEYGSIPHYSGLSASARSRWKSYLAQRFEKPTEDVGPEDWERANGWKIPSLAWVSLDAALRPIEVERATVRWVNRDNGVLRIPKEESSKNQDNWIVELQDRTVEVLDRWIQQRSAFCDYDNTDALWLTREGNQYWIVCTPLRPTATL